MKINQVISEDITGPITKDDIENVFFGDLKKSSEKDTEIEHQIYDYIRQYINVADEYKKPNLIQILNHLKELKPHYPEDLIPKAKVAYRGTKVKPPIYRKIWKQFKVGKFDADKFYEYEFVYRPKSSIQSWSTSQKVADRFAYASNDFKNERLPAVIKVKVDNDFVLTAKITNLISQTIPGLNDPEHEIMRVSNHPIEAKILIHGTWLTKFFLGI